MMNLPTFDPYYQWFGIPSHDQPPSHYQLLGLPEWESDPALITAATDQRLAIVDAQRGGPEEHRCDELAQQMRVARDCLLDAGMKASYDAALKQQAIPMATPIAAPPPSALAASAPVSPIAPPVQAKAALRHGDEDENPTARRRWVRVISTASVIAMGIAGWLIASTLQDNQNNDPANPSAIDSTNESTESKHGGTDESPDPIVVMQEGTGNVVLRPVLATVSGTVELDQTGDTDVLANWGADGVATWRFRIVKGAVFRVVLEYAAEEAWEDAEFEISIGDKSKRCTVRNSGSDHRFHQDEYYLAATTSGEHSFSLRTVGLSGDGLMVLKSVQLEPQTGNLPK